jgi:PAS domain S-box-containing protein
MSEVSDTPLPLKELLVEAVANHRDTFFVFEPETGTALIWNKAFEAVSGYSSEEISQLRAPDSYYSAEDLVRAGEATQQILDGSPIAFEMNLISKEGRLIPSEYTASAINDAEGRPKYIVSFGRDCTEKKQREQSLSERFCFELLINELSALLVNAPVCELDRSLEYALKTIVEFFGVGCAVILLPEQEDVSSCVVHSFSSPGYSEFAYDPRLQEDIARAMAQMKSGEPMVLSSLEELPLDFEAIRQYCKSQGICSGVIIPLLASESQIGLFSLVMFEQERVWAPILVDRFTLIGQMFAGAIVRYRNHVALVQSEARYRKLFSESSDAVFLISLTDLTFIEVNERACKLLGYSLDELLGLTPESLFPEDQRIHLENAIKSVREQGVSQLEICALRKDLTIIPLELSAGIVDQDQGLCQAIARDITIRKRLEGEQQRYAEQLEEEALRTKEYAAALLRSADLPEHFLGHSAAHCKIVHFMTQVADVPASVLILGESGTGKEVVARTIHGIGARANKPFVVVDCAALKSELLESELFGHEKGAFTGAHASKPGLAEVADQGTLFVDEVGEMPLDLQAKLLRLLERGEFRRVGSVKNRTVAIRVIAATNRDLDKEVRAGRFRKDLFYRLNVLAVTIPPLRERPEDIPVLTQHFLDHSRVIKTTKKRIDQNALRCLAQYDWPGNVRELGNVVERAIILSGEGMISSAHLPPELQSDSGVARGPGRVRSLAEVERKALEDALMACKDNKTKAAALLGITRTTLRNKMKFHDIG